MSYNHLSCLLFLDNRKYWHEMTLTV